MTNKTSSLMLIDIMLFSLVFVSFALAADNKVTSSSTESGLNYTSAMSDRGGGLDSLSGSFVTFDPSVGGDACYFPSANHTFCFRAESFTNDWEYVAHLWEKFPSDWSVSNVYVQGEPVCGTGSFGTFNWSLFQANSYEVQIDHQRAQGSQDHCTAYYCFDVTTGAYSASALESWYWYGDGYGQVPHYPCSSDGYTPAGQPGCDEQLNPPAQIPSCSEPDIYLDPPAITLTGCENSEVTTTLTLTNYSGYDGFFALEYSSTLPIFGPPELFVSFKDAASFDVEVHLPCGLDNGSALVSAIGNGYKDSSSLTISVTEGKLTAWESIAPFHGDGRERPAGAAVGNKMYVIGGIDSHEDVVASVEEYDPISGLWVTKDGLMPILAEGICAAAIGDDIYVSGGYIDSYDNPLDILQVYHTDTDSWDTITTDPLPSPKANAGCAALDGKLYVFGGRQSDGTTNTAFVYDPNAPTGNRWMELPEMYYSREHLSGVAVNGKVYAVGGREVDPIAHVEAFDPVDNLWHTLTHMNKVRSNPGVWFFGNNLVACGGAFNDNSCEMYDTTQGYVGFWIDLPQTMITTRYGPAYANLRDGLYVAGGYGDGGIFLNQSERLPFVCPTCPQIEVSPQWLQSTQLPDILSSQTITICNTGEADLAWRMTELPPDPNIKPLDIAGTGQWLYRDEIGTMLPVNGGGETLAHPSVYRWIPSSPTSINVLVYTDDQVHQAPLTFIDQALQYLGLRYTAFYEGNWPGFVEALTSGKAWDLVLVGHESFYNDAWLAPLNTYIQAGGKAIVHTWIMDSSSTHLLWNTMGATFYMDDNLPPAPVYWWQPFHPFFNFPMDVPELTSLSGSACFTCGQYLEPMPGFEALAGYTTPGPDPDQAALVFGNDGRTIFKGFLDEQNSTDLDDDDVLDGVELWIDLINGVAFGVGTDLPWLSEDRLRGTLQAGTCTDPSVTVTFDSSGLDIGDYSGALQISSNDSDAPALTIPVTLTVVVPEIEVSPLSLEIELAPDGTGALSFSIHNSGSAVLDWKLGDDGSWLSENPVSGTTALGTTSTVTVKVYAIGLAPGEHTATITITSNDPDESSISLPVTLTVRRYQLYLPVICR